MLLKSLELQGFKTFPEKTVLNFDAGITTVVGPNGSGKSNISDAIRWVLGEQSAKTIRCSKMEDVIFNGTTERKAKGFASVTLIIENADRRLPVAADEVAITRRLYRSGESEYLINKKEVRLKDVNELFMDTGLGKDGYSMISQGKIDSIVAARSEDRREIFEEAAGISKYRYRKEQAQRKLEQTEENLLRLNDIFNELKERLGPLQEQAEKARAYLELANKKKQIEVGLWLFTLSKSGDILKNYDDKIGIARHQYDEIEKSLEEFNLRIEALSKEILSRTIKVDETNRKISDCEESAIKKSGQVSVLENDILHNNENVQRILKEISGLEQNLPRFEISIKEKNEKIEILKKELAEKNLELKRKGEALKELTEAIEASEGKSKGATEELAELSKMLTRAQVEMMTAKSSMGDLTQKKAEVEQNLNLYEGKIRELNEDLRIKEGNLAEAKLKFDEVCSKSKKSEENIRVTSGECEKLKQVADKLTLDAEAQLRKIRFLEELERNLDGFSHSVKFLTQEAKKSTVSGIHGPVSRLIKVPSEFSVAIETSLGAAMQSIIVDTEDSAKKAIQLLKSKRVGRATFLPISSIDGAEMPERDLLKCVGYVGIASRLCDCDSVYRGILKFLLGRIAVADTLDNATKIAKKFGYKFKVVTLDGQVINAGGSLTGGALAKNVGLLNRKEQIKMLQKEHNEMSAMAKNAKDDFFKAQKKLAKLNKGLEILKLTEAEAKQKADSGEREYQKRLLEFRSAEGLRKNLSKEILEVSRRIDALAQAVQNAGEEAEKLDAQISAAEGALQSAGENKAEIIERRDEVNLRFSDLRIEAMSLEKDIETMSVEVDSALKNCKLTEGQREKLLAEIDALNSKNAATEAKISETKAEIENLKLLSSQLSCDISGFNAEKIKFEKNITELRNLERSTLSEKEAVALEVARLEDKKITAQREYDAIIAKLWDEYELTRREAVAEFEMLEDTPKVAKELNELRLKIKNLGMVNVAAIDEYKEVAERYEFMGGQIDDVERSKKQLYRLISDLTGQMRTLFAEKFTQINKNFDAVFKDLFGGGKATLELADSADVLSSGIEIFVQPPGKIVTHLEALSGGERALVAIALYFSIMKVSPAPFCVLDEIEAALDDVNVERFVAYLRKMNANTQFIVISHRRGTMEEADALYGVTMQNEGVSKLLKLRAFEVEKTFVS